MSNVALDGNVTDQNGAAVPGALVYVYEAPGTLASVYDSMGQLVTNPVTAGEDGYWQAFVPTDLVYTLRYYWGGRERLVEANIVAGIPPLGVNSDPNVRANLAASSGASLVGFIRAEAHAVARTMQDKARETVSVTDWSAFPTNVDCSTALQKALDEAPLGCDLIFPPGLNPDYAYRIEAPLTLSRKLNLIGPGARLAGYLSGSYATSDLLTVNITDSFDLDARNLRVQGFRDISLFSGGRHAILVTDAGSNIATIGVEIANCVVGTLAASTGYAIKFEGIGTHLNNVIHSCQIENGIYCAGADGLTIRDNNIYGFKPGVTVAVVSGAYKTRILDNEIVARDGGVVITSGQQVDIERNQFEQFTGYGANTSTYAGHIVLNGTAFAGGGEEVRDIRIIGNNLGSGSNQAAAIILVANTLDVIIDENVFANIGTSGLDVQILDNSCKWTRIGNRNRVYGPRGGINRGDANTVDPKTLLSVTTATGTGTYGFAARKVPTLAANYTGSTDFAVWKDEAEQLHIEGTIAVGASAAVSGGTVLFTLPDGMRPASAQVIGVFNNLNANPSLLTLNIDGTVTVVGNVSVSSALFIGGAGPVTVRGRSSYLSGPY